jgi:hypothetical protein
MKNSRFFSIANAIGILYCDPSLEHVTKAKAWERDNLFKKCLFKHTPTSVKRWVSTLPSGFPLCDLKIYNVLCFWDKSVDNKFGPNWTLNIPLESSWNIDIESELKFSFKVMT